MTADGDSQEIAKQKGRHNHSRSAVGVHIGRALLIGRSDIVRDALTVEVSRNGHAVLPDAQDVVLAAEVEEFGLDVGVGRSHAQYVGKVVLALAVVDGRNGETLFTRHYAGTKRREANADAKDVAREVMDAALARTLHDFATDPKVVAAFGRRAR
jgi:uncharacterized lipoprotein YajG